MILKHTRLFISDWRTVSDEREVRMYYALGLTMICVALGHFSMALCTWWINITPLLYFNLLGGVFAVFLFALCRKGYWAFAYMAASFEVIAYGFWATYLVGWGANTQWFILLAMMPHFLFLDSRKWERTLITVVGTTAILLAFFVTIYYPSPYASFDCTPYRLQNLINLLLIFSLEMRMNDMVSASSHGHYEQHIKDLERDAFVDPLTELYNRRYFQRFVEDPTQCFACCVVMLDIDHFKNVNDTYGHAAGDAVLQQFAEMVRNQFRLTDVCVRWGGEEFLVLLRGASAENGTAVMERFRKKVEDTEFILPDNTAIHITATIGISSFDPQEERIMDTVLLSDARLYYGKQNGRNQVVYVSSQSAFPSLSKPFHS